MPKITRESARTSHISKQYSAEKIEKLLNFVFTHVDESISRTARFYLLEKMKHKY
jgi:hypothetical protein